MEEEIIKGRASRIMKSDAARCERKTVKSIKDKKIRKEEVDKYQLEDKHRNMVKAKKMKNNKLNKTTI